MVEVPKDVVTSADLAQWYQMKEQLGKLKSAEALLRMRIFRFYFPVPVEGTNKVPLEDGTGAQIKATHVINRDIDQGSLDALRQSMQPQMADDGVTPLPSNVPQLPLDKLVKWKPELAKSEYNKLTAEEKLVFDQCLIVKPGSPQLEISIPARPSA